MLFNSLDGNRERNVAIRIREPAFGALLKELLREWGYTPSGEGEANLLLEEERGSVRLIGNKSADDRLPLPLAVDELWVALGAHFHSPLRRYIRLPLCCSVEVQVVRGQIAVSNLSSLSEMGGRFHYHRELAIGEEIALQLAAAGTRFLLTGKVIYVMERHDVDAAAGSFEIGAVFDRTDRTVRHRLRDLIIAAYLIRARSRLDPAVFAAALTGFRLPECGLNETFA